MDYIAIITLIAKGLSVIQIAAEAGAPALPAIKALYDLARGAQQGTVTAEQLTQTEEVLDALLDQFNQPIE